MEKKIIRPMLREIMDNSVRRKAVYFLFGAMLLVLGGMMLVTTNALNVIRSVNSISSFQDYFSAVEKIQQVNLMILLSAGIYFIFYIACAVVFIMWMFRGYNNLVKSGKFNKMNYSLGWTIGSWFIPLLSLGLPVMLLAEYWKGIQKLAFVKTKEDLSKIKRIPVMGFWWFFYLLGSAYYNMSLVTFHKPGAVDLDGGFETQMSRRFYAAAFLMISTVFLLIMLWQIGKAEDQAFDTHNKLVLENEPMFGME